MVPEQLREAEIDYQFSSPLHDAIDAQKGIKFLEFKQIVAEAVALDPGAAHIPDAVVILRDVANGVKIPSKWLRGEQEVKQLAAQAAEANQEQNTLDQMQQGADVTQTLGAARKDLATAAAVAP